MTQDQAIAILKTGANVFLTGEPGSGKTHTINCYVKYLHSCGIEPAITASTGIAATHISGFTIHSWSGIGVRNSLSKYDLDSIAQNKRVVNRVRSAQVLIIDEVSMLSAQTLFMVDAVLREIRQSKQPFGGLQAVLVGDFFQLPPISPRQKEQEEGILFAQSSRAQFAYMSSAWSRLNLLTCYLSEQHRQEDAVFLELLSAIRRRALLPAHRALLKARHVPRPQGIVAQLYSHNADVDRINKEELAKLSGAERTFEMTSSGSEHLISTLKRGCLSPEELTLKIGARVMFTKNDTTTRRFVNGTLGAVVGFSREAGYPVVKTITDKLIYADPMEWSLQDGSRVLARLSQVPLRLAWAITVHKSQGMSLDAAFMDLSDTFEYGQGYVALSRVRTLAGLSLAGINERALEVHPDISAKDADFREQSETVRQTFAKISSAELTTMQTNFIRACGGTPGKGRTVSKKKAGSTYETTKGLACRGLSLKEMAKERGLTTTTIISHLEKLTAEKQIEPQRDISHLKPPEIHFSKMAAAFEIVYKKERRMLLAPVRYRLGNRFSFDELRLARLFLLVQ